MFVQWIVARLLRLVRRAPAGPLGDDVLIEAISDHIDQFFGVEAMVFHEIVSEAVHIDVHVVPPGPERPYLTLVTSGMGERAMDVPASLPEAPRHVELVMLLPPDWRMETENLKDARWFWPLQHIKMLARAPHTWATWFGQGHTMQVHDDLRPFAENTAFCAYMLAPDPFDEGFSPLPLPDGREITFLMAVPLYAEELAYARAHGTASLVDRFCDADVDMVINPARPNLCKENE